MTSCGARQARRVQALAAVACHKAQTHPMKFPARCADFIDAFARLCTARLLLRNKGQITSGKTGKPPRIFVNSALALPSNGVAVDDGRC